MNIVIMYTTKTNTLMIMRTVTGLFWVLLLGVVDPGLAAGM
jgi:hypothetical protein